MKDRRKVRLDIEGGGSVEVCKAPKGWSAHDICKAIESHDALVETLTRAIGLLESSMPPEGGYTEAFIKKAKDLIR